MCQEYTKEKFKQEMMQYCGVEYDPCLVGRAASSLFYRHQSELDEYMYGKMLDLITMEMGPEFELTREEFEAFLDDL